MSARNGEVVRIVFVIDACDREIIAWSAVADPSIFGEWSAPHDCAVERRSRPSGSRIYRSGPLDNGSAYIVRQTARVAAALVIDLLFTPVRSPRRNVISEAFVKTLKRDYASTAIIADADAGADTVLSLLQQWIDDYFEVHPRLRAQVPLTTRVQRLGA